jgi:hypothetical protein
MIAAALALVLVSQPPTVPERAAPAAPRQHSLRAHFLPPLVSQPPMFTTRPQLPHMLPPLQTARPGDHPGPSPLLPI